MITLLEHDRAAILHGDSAQLGTILGPNSIDAIVTDPPAGIAFMGKSWDENKGGRDEWIAWLCDLMRPAFAALKPGGYALVWAIPRTSHWTATALEDCGFEIRDVHHHIFGTGFPKSLDMVKAIGEGSPEAAQWQGFGTALKPAVEHWILARKPLEGTYAHNVLTHGTGALNIDGCRIGGTDALVRPAISRDDNTTFGKGLGVGTQVEPAGRWPAHLSLEHAPGCEHVGTADEPAPEASCPGGDACPHGDRDENSQSGGTKHPVRVNTGGTLTRDVYRCAIGCPIRILDEQSGIQKDGVAVNRNRSPDKTRAKTPAQMMNSANIAREDQTFGGKGGASRFFYVAKGSRSEKDAGLEHLTPKTGGEATGRVEGSAGTKNARAGAGRTGGARNSHPTVKSVALMRWLIRLITPPGGTVLDPFAGSGTTGVAALDEGCSFIGCEQGGEDGEYLPILVGRINHALSRNKLGTPSV